MMGGWRRAFCTSIPKEREKKDIPEDKQHHLHQSTRSPRMSSRLGFFSNPSTPRLQSQPVSSPSLLCRPSSVNTPTQSLPSSPKLHCKTTSNSSTPSKKNSPLSLFSFSNPSSPKSPSSFSLLKSTLRLNRSGCVRCGICLQSVKSGQRTAIFTAECSHSFHFSCIATRASANQNPVLVCPVCGSSWREALSPSLRSRTEPESKIRAVKTKSLRVYNDDEPLISSPISLAQFNPIPESDETNEVEEDGAEFKGFFVVNTSSPLSTAKNIEITLSPESAVVAAGRGFETYVAVMKVKAPQYPAARGSRGPRRAPVDLVTVLNVSEDMAGVKIQMMKRAMRIVVSSLRDYDRLSIVVFSSSSKRLMPLRRMTANGRRSARRIVDSIAGAGKGMSASDALKKAVKVVEDRRERNIVTNIIVFSGNRGSLEYTSILEQNRSPFAVTTTRLNETSVHTVSIKTPSMCDHALLDDALAKCLTGLLSVPVQDLKLQLGLVSGSNPGEISSVYSLSHRPVGLESGSVRLGDLYSEEEREILVELKVPASLAGSHHILTARSSYVDPTSLEHVHKEQAIIVPRPQAVRSSSAPSIRRLRNLHVSTRAVVESRRLIEREDFSGANHLLSSARALLVRSCSGADEEYVRRVEAEMADLSRIRARHMVASEKADPAPITPTSAWRAAEKLAKVAMMRKHLNRVSDLHGFENARF